MENTAKTIPELLQNTIRNFPFHMSFTEWNYDRKVWSGLTWRELGRQVHDWQVALYSTGLRKEDRVAILLPNGIHAALCDLSVLSNGLIPVPLHAVDTPKSSAFIINNSGARVLFVPKALRWNAIVSTGAEFPHLELVIVETGGLENTENSPVPVILLKDWLAARKEKEFQEVDVQPEDLAAIVYTSGTTGKPKGVMLTHRAIINNVKDFDSVLDVTEKDVFLSFLPFSHTFERTVGYYFSASKGAHIVFSRSVLKVADDLQIHRPTIFVSVPRIYEKFLSVFEDMLAKQGPEMVKIGEYATEIGWERYCISNGVPIDPNEVSPEARKIDFEAVDQMLGEKVRNLFGGRLRYSIVGGAALSKKVARFFSAFGVPLLQGYGLTECSPVISVNRLGRNNPFTVGQPLPSWEVRVGENDELQVKGPSTMKGYWKRPDASAEAITEDGWLRTGDQVSINDKGMITIKGRIKEIIVTSTGEKIAPKDLELAIEHDPLFDQVMAIGESKPFITCLAVVNPQEWVRFCVEQGIDPNDDVAMNRRDIRMAALKKVRQRASEFPQYGVPRNIILLREPWTVENGLLTVTMKTRRKAIAERYAEEIKQLYTTPQAR